MESNNIILNTDSYKLTHDKMYPQATTGVYSYLEARKGAEYPYTVFFGLQALLHKLAGKVVTYDEVDEAHTLALAHFPGRDLFNKAGWDHIVREHDGKLPLLIKAVPEGTPVPINNVMMTVQNTCPECFWLTNAVESLLTHVWYPSTVATRSRVVKEMIAASLDGTGCSRDGLDFMLHDFGYRGASSDESAAIGGAGHLVNFKGTDTLLAMLFLQDYYDADLADLAFSVPATEHSVMTALGREGEYAVVDKLLEDYPTGILSVVADSYDIYGFVTALGGKFKDRIMARDGVFVVRPDSCTTLHRTPYTLMADLSKRLWMLFGGTTNDAGYKVLDPHVRLLWGDGIDLNGVEDILDECQAAGFAAENYVFGMGGGLLQKLNRDTQRFAFKSSAQERDGEWHDVCKEPLDVSKTSKAGKLMLVEGKGEGEFITTRQGFMSGACDLLQPVFENGRILREQTLIDVRERAAI